MPEKARRNLQLLESNDRRRVVTYWRWLLLKQNTRHLPLPLKIGFIDTGIVGYQWKFAHTFDKLPLIFVPVIWIIIFVVGLSICILIHIKPRQPHWVK